jgi:hypothetical protein
MTGKKVFISYGNLFTIEKCLAFKQRNDTTTTEFALQVNSMYTSVIHQNGKYAFGLGYYDLVLQRHSMVFKDYIALKESDTGQYDNEVQELIVSMLIVKGSNHGRARTELQQQYAFGTMTDDFYPTTEEKVISLLDTFSHNNNNNNDNNISNNDDHDAVVAAIDASQDCYSDDDDDSDDKSLLLYASEEQKEVNGATLLVNIDKSPTNKAGFRAMILANAVAKYDNGILEIEDNFINRNNNINHQDLSGAFDDNEHDVLACAHVVINRALQPNCPFFRSWRSFGTTIRKLDGNVTI